MTSKLPRFHAVGQRYHDFEVTKIVDIAELQCRLCELVHLPTGAQVMHIANDDPENLFCLSFQTLPESSDGIAHILEHTVLCGSKKYPVKDPFFSMTRRSLNTFMNALTGPDFTCYPAATQVHKDFYNLLEVYLDAVFHPSLDFFSFLQEGHRLEFALPEDLNSPLEYKGIVFNEMKGAMGSPNARLHEAMNCGLFPNLTYGCNSGGDPKEIIDLTYEDLKEFHEKFYQPSRCLFYFYGNMPLEGHLDFIAEHVLKDAVKVPPLPPVPAQPRFSEPRIVMEKYAVPPEEPLDHKTYISFGWLTSHILNQEELLALTILQVIILATDASPLKMALLKSGLCKQVSSYLDTDISEAPFVITLQGCNAEDVDRLQMVLRVSLEQIASTGIPLQQVEDALHQLEFHRSEIGADHGPFGLALFMRSALIKQHGADPEEGLKIHSLSDQLRKHNLADPNYFSHLIHKHLLNNQHFVCVIMQPDNELGAKERENERAELAAIKDKLSLEEKEAIVKQAADLVDFQNNLENNDPQILPKLVLDDIPKSAREFPLLKEKIEGLEVFHHTVFTNGIVYADLLFDLPYVAEEDLSLVRLFTLLLPQMGAASRDYAANLDYIQAHTGGVGASLTFNLQANDPYLFSPSIYLRGKALHRKADKLFHLLSDMATSVDFNDVARLREVIMKHFTSLQGSLHQNALRYAINLSASGLDVSSKIANRWYGLEYYWKIKEVAENFDKELPSLLATLNRFKKQLLCLASPNLVITSDASSYDQLKNHRFYGLADLPVNPSKPWNSHYSLEKVVDQGRISSSPVAFIAKVFKTAPYTDVHAPALNIAAFLCNNLILHPKIREQGGAYGGGAVCNSMAANFYFYSYRDPNISTTLDAFDEAIAEILEGNFEDSDLEEAKFEMIQALDSPIPPGQRGDVAYGWMREGKPYEVRQAFRKRLLAVTDKDVIAAVKSEIIPRYRSAATVVFANQELLRKENMVLSISGKPTLDIQKL